MKSAYMVLGLPGNASGDDIEIAFAKARLHFTPERLAASERAVQQLHELKLAYEVLRTPDSRAAHDRKLAASTLASAAPARPAVVVEEPERNGMHRLLVWGGLALALVVAAGIYINHRNAEVRRQQAALELQTRQLEAQERERQREEALRAEQAKAAAKAKQEAEERRFTNESRYAAQRSTYESYRYESAAVQAANAARAAALQAQRQEAQFREEERRNAYEARRRVESDKQRIRELCMQQYRRPDC